MSDTSEIPPNTILVSDLAPATDEKKVADFFSFCGKITKLSLRKASSSTQAIVSFETESAAKTALLLTNAQIDDRTITVVPYSSEDRTEHVQQDEAQAARTNDDDIIFDETADVSVSHMDQQDIPVREAAPKQTAASIIATIVASGYTLGAGTIASAKGIDEQRGISTGVTGSVTAGSEAIKEKSKQIDEQYGISEQASQISERVSQSLAGFEEQYHVMETTNTGLAAASAKVNQWGDVVSQGIQSAIEAPTVQSTWSSIKTWGNNFATTVAAAVEPATSAVSQEYAEIKQVTAAKIDEKMVEKGFEAPSVVAAREAEKAALEEQAAKEAQAAGQAVKAELSASVEISDSDVIEMEEFDSAALEEPSVVDTPPTPASTAPLVDLTPSTQA